MPTNVLDQQCPLHCTPRHLRDEDNSRINTVATHVVQTALEAHKLAGFILWRTSMWQPVAAPTNYHFTGMLLKEEHSIVELSRGKGLRSHHICRVNTNMQDHCKLLHWRVSACRVQPI